MHLQWLMPWLSLLNHFGLCLQMKVNAPAAYKLRVPDQQLAPATAV